MNIYRQSGAGVPADWDPVELDYPVQTHLRIFTPSADLDPSTKLGEGIIIRNFPVESN